MYCVDKYEFIDPACPGRDGIIPDQKTCDGEMYDVTEEFLTWFKWGFILALIGVTGGFM